MKTVARKGDRIHNRLNGMGPFNYLAFLKETIMFTKQIQEMVQTSYEMTNQFTKLWIENYKTYVVPMVDQTASTIEKSISAFKAK